MSSHSSRSPGAGFDEAVGVPHPRQAAVAGHDLVPRRRRLDLEHDVRIVGVGRRRLAATGSVAAHHGVLRRVEVDRVVVLPAAGRAGPSASPTDAELGEGGVELRMRSSSPPASGCQARARRLWAATICSHGADRATPSTA